MSYRFNPGDYVCGIEHRDSGDREMRGWIDRTLESSNSLFIQADDIYGGNRVTIIDLNSAYPFKHIDKWWEANKREIPVGTVVKHFKNKLYKILGYADHVDGGRCVIYEALYSPYKVYIREYSEFMSEVDHNKYPDVQQKYRFEAIEV